MASLLLIMLELVFDTKETQLGLSGLVVRSSTACFLFRKVFHLLLSLLIVKVIFIRISERLIGFKLFLDHSLQNSVMRELFLHF